MARTRPILDSPDDAERIAGRYPRSWWGRPAGRATLAVAAVLLLTWLGWTALDLSQPAVSGRVDRYVITPDAVEVTLSVQRPDPSVAVSCLVIAQAQNYERVGEVRLEVPPGDQTQVQQVVQVRTFRQAAAASLDHCEVV